MHITRCRVFSCWRNSSKNNIVQDLNDTYLESQWNKPKSPNIFHFQVEIQKFSVKVSWKISGSLESLSNFWSPQYWHLIRKCSVNEILKKCFISVFWSLCGTCYLSRVRFICFKFIISWRQAILWSIKNF